MFSLPTRLGSLALKFFAETTKNEYKDSTTSNLQAQILGTNNNDSSTRGEIKAESDKRNQEKLQRFWQHQMKKQKE